MRALLQEISLGGEPNELRGPGAGREDPPMNGCDFCEILTTELLHADANEAVSICDTILPS